MGQKQVRIDYLEKMIEIAKTDLNIDIKKTTTPHNQVVQGKPARSSYSMNQLYEAIGISKQAAHQYAHQQSQYDRKITDLVARADELRAAHPGWGREDVLFAQAWLFGKRSFYRRVHGAGLPFKAQEELSQNNDRFADLLPP